MSRKITIGLNQNEISNLISQLNNIASKLDKMAEKLTDDIAEIALNEMVQNYNSSQYQPSDGMSFSKTGTAKDKKVSMIGTQAIYNEFGTGTMGEQNPHPQKSDFALNDYNSGSTIRRNTKNNSIASNLGIPANGLYWTFKDENGITHYTQGIPAQKQVYNAGIEVQKQMPEIIEKNLRRIFE